MSPASLVDALASSPLALKLGWVFLHFLWQGAIVAGALALVLAGLRQRGAGARYAACCAALGLLLFVPVATFLVLGDPAPVRPAQVIAALSQELGVEPGPAGGGLHRLVPALTAFWLLGALIQQARMLFGWWSVQRLKHRFHRPMPATWERVVAEMRARLGIRVRVDVVESALARVPTVVGWLAPVVLVPTSALLSLSPEQLRMVLAHELAHVRRHDYLVNLIQTAVESLLFFHPAVWWISKRARVEREYCCDDIALELGGNGLVYARALERLETLRAEQARLAIASTGGSLMERIQRLVQPRSQSRRGFAFGAVPALLVTLGVFATTAYGFAAHSASLLGQDPKEMSNDELEARIAELRHQIDELETKLGRLRAGRQGGDAHETHEIHVEPGKRKFDVRVDTDGSGRFEIHVPEIRVPEIHVPETHLKPGRYEIRIPEIRIPKVEVPEVHVEVDAQALQHDLGSHLEDMKGNLKRFRFHFEPGGEDSHGEGGLDAEKLRKEIEENVERALKGVDWNGLENHWKGLDAQGMKKLDLKGLEKLKDLDLKGLEKLKGLDLKGLEELKGLDLKGLEKLKDLKKVDVDRILDDVEIDVDSIQDRVLEALKKIEKIDWKELGKDEHGNAMLEIEPGVLRRLTSEDGAWIGTDDGEPHGIIMRLEGAPEVLQGRVLRLRRLHSGDAEADADVLFFWRSDEEGTGADPGREGDVDFTVPRAGVVTREV